MIVLLVTSKTMNFEKIELKTDTQDKPLFNDEVKALSSYMKSLGHDEIKSMMKVSDKIAENTISLFSEFSMGKNKGALKPAVFSFTGEVYRELDPLSFNRDDLFFANERIRILSGLYGILTPLTEIEEYRLEMGYKVWMEDFIKLSAFWREKVTDEMNSLINSHEDDFVIDLASKEYTDSIDKKKFKGRMIDIIFQDFKDGKFKTIAIYSKRARGQMANYIVKNRIKSPDGLKSFNEDGYVFNREKSSLNKFVFTR